MPTYDYHCDACHHDWELFQKITDEPETTCPACRKKKARRLFGTGAAIMFKGSGFYETDYRSDSYKKGADAAKEKSDSSGGKSGDAKSETGKPAAKAETKAATADSKSTAPKNKSEE
jgi:putative FmdB family regulatory protein